MYPQIAQILIRKNKLSDELIDRNNREVVDCY